MNENEYEYKPTAAELPDEEETLAPVAEEPITVEVEDAEELAVPEPEPMPKDIPAAKATPNPIPHVVGSGEYDEVFLNRCVYKNVYARKSLTVHHLQRRLGELGYGDAMADRDGWYGDLTKESVKQFQGDNKLEASGIMDAKTFERIFAGDTNVKVVTSQE
jgi:hypothetical protein